MTGAGTRDARFDAGVPSLDEFSRRSADAYRVGCEAYVWGYPLVAMQRTLALHASRHAVNRLVHEGRLWTHEDRDVVTPNNDTIYSLAWLDLRAGPQRLTLPAASSERYFSFAILDMYSNTVHVAHGGAGSAHEVLLVGPGSRTEPAPGVEVVRSPTPDVWLIGRTFVNGSEDLAAARDFQQQYRLTGPPSPGPVPPGTDGASLPRPQAVPSTGVAVFDEISAGMAADPPPVEDVRLVGQMAAAGIRPAAKPSEDPDPAVIEGLTAAIAAGERLIDLRQAQPLGSVNGWGFNLNVGRYGRDYLNRARQAKYGLGALPPEEAIYMRAEREVASGETLTGARRYVLHFAAGQLPPVRPSGFWSVTMYDATTFFLVGNPVNRYVINSANRSLVYNPDGSLDIYVQAEPPVGHEPNWLPAPPGELYLNLRIYLPTEEVQSGNWEPPALQPAG